MTPPGTESQTRKIILTGLWRDNPIFKQVLGICSTLAVTNLEYLKGHRAEDEPWWG